MGNNANFSHFFNAYGILKLLFKKRGEEFIGRFHDRYPITVKNPITNCRIIGEVEFYKITNQRIVEQQQREEERKLRDRADPAASEEGVEESIGYVSDNNVAVNSAVAKMSEINQNSDSKKLIVDQQPNVVIQHQSLSQS